MDNGQWIWLDESTFPDCIYCGRSIWSEDKSYALVELCREYSFDKPIHSVSVRLFADTRYTLYANGELVAFGPSCYGGDYGDDGRADYPAHWSDFDFDVSGSTLALRAEKCALPTEAAPASARTKRGWGAGWNAP